MHVDKDVHPSIEKGQEVCSSSRNRQNSSFDLPRGFSYLVEEMSSDQARGILDVKDFDLDYGVEDMKDFDLSQGALGLNLVRKSYVSDPTRATFDLVRKAMKSDLV